MPLNRLEAAARRLGVQLAPGQKLTPLPRLSEGQIAALEAAYPVRLLKVGESVEAYRHYCGAADLVQQLKSIAGPIEGTLAEDDEEWLDEEAVGRAIAAHNAGRASSTEE